jgi:amino acid transporter
MEIVKVYENYPVRIIILSNTVSILIYLLGFMITLSLSWVAAILYSVFILFQEYKLVCKQCVNCYYWGKSCAFGKGRLSSVICKRGDISKFSEKIFKWEDLIPDLLVSLIPLITALVLLIIKFNLLLLLSMIFLIALTTIGNSYVRGKLACKYCKQREIGCPAEQLFNKSS